MVAVKVSGVNEKNLVNAHRRQPHSAPARDGAGIGEVGVLKFRRINGSKIERPERGLHDALLPGVFHPHIAWQFL
jgi:hypothetical protein